MTVEELQEQLTSSLPPLFSLRRFWQQQIPRPNAATLSRQHGCGCLCGQA